MLFWLTQGTTRNDTVLVCLKRKKKKNQKDVVLVSVRVKKTLGASLLSPTAEKMEKKKEEKKPKNARAVAPGLQARLLITRFFLFFLFPE